MKDTGIARRNTGLDQKETKFTGSLEEWVAVRYQIVREMIPGPAVSDEAARLFLKKMVAIAEVLGADAFQKIMEEVIDTCERRPTVAQIRRMAGLQRVEPPPAVEAWRLITNVVQHHLQRVGEGSVEMKPWIKMANGVAEVINPPAIPSSVMSIVSMMGGWQALLESYPAYWNMRWMTFKEMFVPSETGIVVKK